MTPEHARRRALERTVLNRYWPRRDGPSKSDLQRELAEAVRNTQAISESEEQP